MSCETPVNLPTEQQPVYGNGSALEPADSQAEPTVPVVAHAEPEAQAEATVAAPLSEVPSPAAPADQPVTSDVPRCLSRAPRKSTFNSTILTQEDIAQEILARAEKKRQNFPDAVDVLVALKSTSQLKIPQSLAGDLLPPPPTPPKLPKLRDENKRLDAKDLLQILQDGGDLDAIERKSKTPTKSRTPRPKLELHIDPDLERELALKQLMEFSSRKPRRGKNGNNAEAIKTEKGTKQEKPEDVKDPKPKKRSGGPSNGPPAKRGVNRELQKLLQDEGAINMLYEIERGDVPEGKDRLAFKRRTKKVLKKKAQEVEAAILVATSSRTNSRSLRTSEKRKQSIDSTESEEPQASQASAAQEQESQLPPPPSAAEQPQFNFPAQGECSKIIRRHSSSSSYSSREGSPRRMSLDRERSPVSNADSSQQESKQEIQEAAQSTPASESGQDVSELSNLSLYPTQTPPSSSTSTQPGISERTEKLIELKVRQMNLQPRYSAVIKQLIVEKKNGLRERLQNEFAMKFKAALPTENNNTTLQPVLPSPPGVKLNEEALAQLRAKAKSLVTNQQPLNLADAASAKPAWKVVADEWDSGEEGDPDDPPAVKQLAKSIKMERRSSRNLESDLGALADLLKSRINASTRGTCLSPRVQSRDDSALPNTELRVPKVEGRHGRSPTPELPPSPTSANQMQELTDLPAQISGPTPGSDVRLERANAVIRLYIKPTTCRLPNSLNSKVLNELTQALNYLESSSDIRVIMLVFPPLHDAMAAISESENNIDDLRDAQPDVCAGRISPTRRSSIVEMLPTDQVNHSNGVDLLSLCSDSSAERRQVATETANAIKNLTHKLATCSRLVCTAVSGKAIGLSVVLLAYCDFVLADDSATFSTPYAQLGYLPEAAATHTLPHIIGRRKTSWLLLGGGTLTATEAEVCGLVTQVVARRSHLAHELNALAKSLATTSLLSAESAKGMMNHGIRSTISNSLSTEAKVLETHWSAPDTQRRMKNFAVQLVMDMHQAAWKERESRSREQQSHVDRTGHTPHRSDAYDVPLQNLVFEEASDALLLEPLQPVVDELHFDDPASVPIRLPSEDPDYQIQQLR
ncbi:Enoyl-CoA hydratase/isomerase family [Nesidiocoris tenuis]|uniref:Enoyl-CoA hydratase/isomerase family n=1 Tax=Nesidiocoris tenuis TaxID=355587 RepID=A0ABN7BGC8_9HEMI|nr:Enoyl-CoA hydratase/isomerase family [Nesidiocoris tenuis]